MPQIFIIFRMAPNKNAKKRPDDEVESIKVCVLKYHEQIKERLAKEQKEQNRPEMQRITLSDFKKEIGGEIAPADQNYAYDMYCSLYPPEERVVFSVRSLKRSRSNSLRDKCMESALIQVCFLYLKDFKLIII